MTRNGPQPVCDIYWTELAMSALCGTVPSMGRFGYARVSTGGRKTIPSSTRSMLPGANESGSTRHPANSRYAPNGTNASSICDAVANSSSPACRGPSALVVVPTQDAVADHGRRYAERMWAAGTSVRLTEYPGAWHAFLTLPGMEPQAEVAQAEILEFPPRGPGRVTEQRSTPTTPGPAGPTVSRLGACRPRSSTAAADPRTTCQCPHEFGADIAGRPAPESCGALRVRAGCRSSVQAVMKSERAQSIR
ncbi:alpha/beta hydrolase [Nocardia sp. CA-151230]|uniref:alpha/beta hydrolase n=1 Tax=Nocardia sp. CA-151230 TaxID=3239982 RepID=UPI003D8DB7E7